MLYPIVRPIATLGLQVYFRKIYLAHPEHLPADKPVILAANHPTAFLEPCILACFLEEPLYFLVRGDFFANPFYSFLLRQLHMLPVFRKRDGRFSDLKNNFATFEACFDALRHNKTIMILAEGRTQYEKRLGPMQKGAARMAFGALNKYPELEDVYVVPVGVTYTEVARMRSDVLISLGKPFSTRAFLDEYKRHPNEAATRFLDTLHARIAREMVIIPRPEDDELGEQLLTVFRTSFTEDLFPTVSESDTRLRGEQGALTVLDQPPDARKDLQVASDDYREQLHAHRIADRDVAGHERPNLLHALFLLLGFPFFALGYLWNGPPLWLARWIATRYTNNLEFFASVKVSVGIFGWLFWFIGWWIAAALLGSPWWWAVPLAMVLSGLAALYYRDLLRWWRGGRRWDQLTEGEQNALRRARRELVDRCTRVYS